MIKWFICGLFIGNLIRIGIMCILQVTKGDDEETWPKHKKQ